MLSQQLAKYSQIPIEQVEYFLSLTSEQIFQDHDYQNLVRDLDSKRLGKTLGAVRDVYNNGLPRIKHKYDLSDTVMSGHTLGNWILGFLMYPERLPDLLDRHTSVPVNTVVEALPDLLALLESIPEGGQDWQRALTVFALPLVVRSV